MGRANLGISGALGIAGALGLGLGCTPTPPPRPPDVLLVVLDTVRADALPIGGNPRNTAPQVQAIADAGRVFTQAVAPGCWTWPVHASLFTGQDPWVHGAHHAALDDVLAGAPIATSLDRSLPTLAEAFTAAGYRTASISANGLLGPGSELVRGFAKAELYDDDDDRVVQRAQQLLSDDDPRPVFIFVNLLGSHLPYEAWPTAWTAPHAAALHPDTAPDWLGPWLSVESGRPHLRLNRPAPDGGPAPVRAFSAGQWAPGPEGLALLKDVYESEVLATDALLHRLMQTWNATGRGAGITLVTSDHGEHFGEQDMLDHGHGVWGAVTHVPLVIAAPGRVVPGTDDQPVSLSRVAPTLISLAGIEGAAATAILTQPSLLAEDVPAAPVVSACWADPVWAQQLGGRFVHDQWMLRDGPLALVDIGDNSLLFNVLDDPMMLKDLSSAQPDAVRRLRALLAQQRPPTTDRTSERPTLSPGTIEAMQQLGYLDPPPGPPRGD